MDKMLGGLRIFCYTAAMITTPTSSISFGRRLKQLRSRRDLTQEALAELAFCSVQTIRVFETGKRRPAVEMAQRLADILQVPVAEQAEFVRLARQPLATEAATPVDGVEMPSPPIHTIHRPPLIGDPLIGREPEINVLRQLLLTERCRLVTVIGVGGMGKTRLALAAAHTFVAHFADGAAFVALAPLQAAHQLPGAVADALGLVLQGARETKLQVFDYLATRRLLLVLDNFEHLLAADQDQATGWLLELLQNTPGLHLLVTSRERLRLSGERIFELGGLSLPHTTVDPNQSDAVRLFMERAQQADIGFAATEQDTTAIGRICQLMDGMPLALELAAAWVRILSCAEIADEIQRSLDFLVLADRDMAPRHRSMRAVFDHSWSLLMNEERRVLAALSVFRGGCTREATQAVAGATLAVLAGLIDKSLVRRVGEVTGQARYELHELTRQYADQRLAEDPAQQQAAQERHGDFYARFVKKQETALGTAQQMVALTQIEQEIDNIRHAWLATVTQARIGPLQQMVNGLGQAFYWRGRYHEGVHLFRTVLTQLPPLPPAGSMDDLRFLHCEVRTWLGCFLTQVGDVGQVESLFTQVFADLADLATTGYDVRACQALAYHEFAYFQMGTVGDYRKAYALQLESVALYRQLGYQHYLSRALARQSRILHFLGQYREAIVLSQEAIAIGQANGDQLATTGAVEGLALSLTYLGEFTAAEPHFRTALAAAEATQQPGRTSGVLTNLGVVLTFAGRFAEGQAAWQRALAISREVGDRNYVIHSAVLLGFSALHLGDYATAIRQAQAGIDDMGQFGYVRDAALARLLLGSAQLAQGEPVTAYQTLNQAIALYRTIAHPHPPPPIGRRRPHGPCCDGLHRSE